MINNLIEKSTNMTTTMAVISEFQLLLLVKRMGFLANCVCILTAEAIIIRNA